MKPNLPIELNRGQEAVPCECGGYCDKVACTEEECSAFGCGRDRPGYSCCAIAFVCRLCGRRYHGYQPAPEADFS